MNVYSIGRYCHGHKGDVSLDNRGLKVRDMYLNVSKIMVIVDD